jgi:integral membrane protein (TIGR00529 family)
MIVSWIGLVVSIAVILGLARKHLPLALVAGAVVLGLFTLTPGKMLATFASTLTDLSIILLAAAMGVIPMIGGIMKESGQMDDLVNNLRISRKGLMGLSPAIMGLLPMPGGALLSAPILERGGIGVPADLKVAINDWFRHLLVMIYPLSSALIASAKISNLNVYTAALYLLPTCMFALILGYVFFVRRVEGVITYNGAFSLKKLLLPLCVVLSAPVLDFTLKKIPAIPIPEIATLCGVLAAFILALILSTKKLSLGTIARNMKPWNFSLIIIGMFIFLYIFKASNVASLIARIPLPPVTLCVVTGFALGVATGRVLLPASIIIPVYLTMSSMTPVVFATVYTSIFFGYVISPVHPCVGVSLEYFSVSLKDFLRLLAGPTFIVFSACLLISFFI